MAANSLLLPPPDSIAQLPSDDQARILDVLFEPSQELHKLSLESLRTTRFLNYDELATSVGRQLHALSESSNPAHLSSLDSILGAHPRLGEKKVDSAQSQSEQAHLKEASESETARLSALNSSYESTFPGLRYVVFVNGRPRTEIMDDMQHRIGRNDLKLERIEGIQAMVDIAKDRASKLLG